MGKNDCIAVLTGDLIRYRKYAGDPNQYIDFLTDALDSVKKGFDFQYQIFRGDSFQGILRQPEKALEVSLLIRSHLLSQPYLKRFLDPDHFPTFERNHQVMIDGSDGQKMIKDPLESRCDTRIAIGVGDNNYLDEQNVGSSDGQAFRLSGYRLDEMKRTKQNLSVITPWNEFNDEIEIECDLLDVLIDRWTREQAMVVYLSLNHMKQEEISGVLRITQSSVSQRLSRTGFSSLEKTIARFDKKIFQYGRLARSDGEKDQ
jgi:predicted XRE-type DNA-binding protein